MSKVSGQGNWAQLFRIACDLIRQANSKQVVIDHWTFGGGTAMMLQIDHRESHDIDIFLNDPQQLPFLDPQKQDFRFEIRPDAYEGDGVRSLKLVIEQLRPYKDRVTQTLAAMEKLNPAFVSGSIADLAIKDHYKELAKTALDRSKKILRAV